MRISICVFVAALGCGDDMDLVLDASTVDAGVNDGGAAEDAGTIPDAGAIDAGAVPDAGGGDGFVVEGARLRPCADAPRLTRVSGGGVSRVCSLR